MNLEDQVCALEYAKRLAELGVNKMSYFEWLKAPHKNDYDAWEVKPIYPKQVQNLGLPAYSVAELGVMLPQFIDFKSDDFKTDDLFVHLTILKDGDKFTVVYLANEISFTDNNEANARAKMLIYLLDQGLMMVPE